MMRHPGNLLIFAVLGGLVGLSFGLGLGTLFGDRIDPNADSEITEMLSTQVAAWNAGDIEAYMADYVTGDALRFASGGTVEQGWDETLARYRERYPDRATMGQLTTENFDIDVIGPDDALVFGSWKLAREADAPSGLYTLHVRRVDGEWVILSDHTSSAE